MIRTNSTARRVRCLFTAAALGLLAALPAAAAAPVLAAPAAAPSETTRAAVKEVVTGQARLIGLPVPIALAVAKVESDFQANTLARSGARGVMQVMPEAALEHYGVTADELFEVHTNVELGLDRLKRLYAEHGDWRLALSHYHAGGIREAAGVREVLPAAADYVAAVLRWRDRYQAQAALWNALDERDEKPVEITLSRAAPRAPAAAERRRIVVVHDDFERRLAIARATLDSYGSDGELRRGRQVYLGDGSSIDRRPR